LKQDVGWESAVTTTATGRHALFDLTGKVAVVTGGGRGIGRAIALGLSAHGARVIPVGRTLASLDETVAALTAAAAPGEPPQKHFGVAMDVGIEADVERARDAVLNQAGKIDILVNNAGIDPHYAPLEKTTQAQWDAIVAVNLSGVFRCCRLLGTPMLAQKSGSIINISSIAGHVALKRQVPYCATKGGVEQLTKALSFDWADQGIRVNAIAYGFVDTDLTSSILSHPHIGPRYLARVPMGRFGTLDDVAGAAVFLASPAASYVTGHSLVVDGGWTAS
jgi:NAD(P)-dependent dehydrogenase (short-subunit alcohol dehydrogenase family)